MNQMTIGLTDPPQEFVDRIAEWFCGSFADPYKNPRMDKSTGLYRLASLIERGCIVELGAYQGNGAVALASGAPGRITYTIDDFDHHMDWMGNQPGRADKALLLLNIDESGLPIAWINSTAEKAAVTWNNPIGLLYWDTGSYTIHDDFEMWSRHLIPGGMFVMHDTDDRTFHSDEIERAALAQGWTLGPKLRMLYTVVKPE